MPKQAYAFAHSVHGLIVVLDGLIPLPANDMAWHQARNNCQRWQADPSTIFFVDQSQALANPELQAAIQRTQDLTEAQIRTQNPHYDEEQRAVQARLRELGLL